MVFKRLQIPEEIIKETVATLNQVHQDKIEFHNKHYDKLTSEQKGMDNLYLDKLKGRITESEYDRFYTSLRDHVRLEKLQDAEDNYHITSKYVLKLSNRAHELFMSSEVDKKRQLIKLILQNLKIDAENILWELHEPFDKLLKCSEDKVWRPLVDTFRNYEAEFSFNLEHIKSTYTFLGITVS